MCSSRQRRWVWVWPLTVALAAGATSGGVAWGQSRPTTDGRQRLTDLAALVEGDNSQTIRRTGARELLRIRGDASSEQVTRILRFGDVAAKTAMAGALSDMPEAVRDGYIEPLLGMLGCDSEAAREAAIAALIRSPGTTAITRLRQLALDARAPTAQRVDALAALGQTVDHDSLETLVRALSSPDGAIADAALGALRQAVALAFPGGAADAIAWWQQSRAMPWEQWQHLQIQRLSRENSRLSHQTRDLEARLTATLREAYFRLPEQERDAVLLAHLSDAAAPVRLLGLELVQSRVAEGKAVSPEIALLTDGLLTDASASVRAAAARTVTAFRNPEDATRFVELISEETDRPTRLALINGLGYLGGADTVAALVNFMGLPDEESVDEVVGALGRLAERGVIPADMHDEVAQTLMDRFPEICGKNGEEARLLWAMGRLADDRFGPLFVQRLNSDAPAAARMAALRGLTILIAAADPAQTPEAGARVREWMGSVVAAAEDPDVAIRRLAIETLAKATDTGSHLDVLWAHAFAPLESDESIRKAAWSGALAVLATRPAETVLDYLARFREQSLDDPRRRVELLQLAETKVEGEPEPSPALLADVRTDLASALVAAGQIDAAISAYIAVLPSVRVAKPDDVEELSIVLLRLALLNGRYDDQVAAAIGDSKVRADGGRLWAAARELIDARSKAELLPQAIEMADALAKQPPAQFGPEILSQLSDLQKHVRGLLQTYQARSVNEALVRLREQPDDAAAKQSIVDLGSAALPALVEALKAILSSEPVDVEAERRIHDLIKQIKPDWPGFPADAQLEKKLEMLSEPSA